MDYLPEKKYYKNGKKYGVIYYKNGYRILNSYFENGNIFRKQVFLINKLHCEDAPSEIYYFENGNINRKCFYKNGKLHRKNKPAYIEYFNNNITIFRETYFFKNKMHRTDGPAIIWYDENGNFHQEEYRVNGKKINSQDLPFDLPIDTEEKELYIKLLYGK